MKIQRGRRTDGESTKLRLVLAAQRLVAIHGVSAFSLRQASLEAGQRNNSAALYHFGSRQGILDAVLEHGMLGVNERRLQLLDKARDRAGIADLVDALVLPLVDAVNSDPALSYFAGFLAQALSDPSMKPKSVVWYASRVSGMVTERRSTGHAKPRDLPRCLYGLWDTFTGLDRSLDQHVPRIRRHRMILAGKLLMHAVSDRERFAVDHTATSHRRISRKLTIDLIAAMSGLLTAPSARLESNKESM